MTYRIGIDIGTSGTKVAVFDENGYTVAESTKEYPLFQPHNGWAEQNPDDWWKATCEGLREVTGKIPASGVVGVGFSGQMHGLVLLDEADRVIRPAILWCDNRTFRESEEIQNLIGQERLMEVTASPAVSSFTAAKLRWVRKNEPENYRRIRHILLPKDYVRFRMSGEYVTDASDASGMQLLHIRARSFDRALCDDLDVPFDCLPSVAESCEAAGRVTDRAAAETGLKAGTILAAGAGDNAASAVGTGTVTDGKAFTTLGTSGVVFAHTRQFATDGKGTIHSFCAAVPDEYHTMGVIQSACLSLQWFRKNFAPTLSYAELDRMAEPIPIGSDRLIYLPYLTGERTPHLDPLSRGVFFGLSSMHTTAHLYRAVLEGVSFALMDAFRLLSSVGPTIRSMALCGGGARSPLWRQMLSDVYQVPLTDMSDVSGGARGAAILGGVAGGFDTDVVSACERMGMTGTVTEPDAGRHDTYMKSYELYRQLYVSLKDHYRALADL